MTIGWLIVVIVVVFLFLLYQNRVLQRLSLFSDEALARRIIEAGRLKSAETRIELYEREDRHMCLTPTCRSPVIGKWIFAHCELHLKPWEKRWLKEDIESPSWKRASKDDSEHPLVTSAKKIIEDKDAELVKENGLKKEKALIDARDLLDRAHALELERRTYLPRILQARIEHSEKEQQKALRGSWVPPNLAELINQKAENDG